MQVVACVVLLSSHYCQFLCITDHAFDRDWLSSGASDSSDYASLDGGFSISQVRRLSDCRSACKTFAGSCVRTTFFRGFLSSKVMFRRSCGFLSHGFNWLGLLLVGDGLWASTCRARHLLSVSCVILHSGPVLHNCNYLAFVVVVLGVPIWVAWFSSIREIW